MSKSFSSGPVRIVPRIVAYSRRGGELLGVAEGSLEIIHLANLIDDYQAPVLTPVADVVKKRTRGPNKPKAQMPLNGQSSSSVSPTDSGTAEMAS